MVNRYINNTWQYGRNELFIANVFSVDKQG